MVWGHCRGDCRKFVLYQFEKEAESLIWKPRSHVVEYGMVLYSQGNVIDERVLRACVEAGAKLAKPEAKVNPYKLKPQLSFTYLYLMKRKIREGKEKECSGTIFLYIP
ncbi:hypothetical protein M9H77_23486 [Catharanthus roseus]|uniref:Uncharacterized protein n=1 Tax=Catharanthus roseus TaxID=4058 RepID=A0ACC0AXK5_CATRO|nr:hypothetical protein M9H77_23486 [Catharanthus roseus]